MRMIRMLLTVSWPHFRDGTRDAAMSWHSQVDLGLGSTGGYQWGWGQRGVGKDGYRGGDHLGGCAGDHSVVGKGKGWEPTHSRLPHEDRRTLL